jgi:hypothetical protein
MVGALAEGWRTEDDLGLFLLPLLLLSVGRVTEMGCWWSL